jgi:GT2 family glycosyltransferase
MLDANPDLAVSFHNVTCFSDDGSASPWDFCTSTQRPISTLTDLLQGHFIQTCSALFRNHIIGEFPDWYAKLFMGDWPLFILLAQHGNLGYIGEVMARHRFHPGGVWSSLSQIRRLEVDIEALETFDAHFQGRYSGILRPKIADKRKSLDLLKLKASIEESDNFQSVKRNGEATTLPDPNAAALGGFESAHRLFAQEHFPAAVKAMEKYRTGIDYESFPRSDRRFAAAPLISVIIVAYQTKALLLDCLKTLGAQSDTDFEIVVVDNGGNESIWDELEKLPILHVKCPLNLILSEGRNIGSYFARGQILALLDDDALVPGDYISSIRRAFATYAIAGFRGKVLPKSDNANNRLAGHYDYGDSPLPTTVDTEGNSAFLRDIYLEQAGMDPLLFGGEGLDLSYRIAKVYGENLIIYWPQTVIYHDYAFSNDKLQAKQERHERVRRYLTWKYGDIYAWHERTQAFRNAATILQKAERLIRRRPLPNQTAQVQV